MICLHCKGSFNLDRLSGSGGRNRIYCFKCLPHGLSRDVRKRIAFLLHQKTIANHKINYGCQVCGYKKTSHALEFHHVIKDGKDGNPSDFAKSSLASFFPERAKCIVLCSNCHREHHAGLLSQELMEEILSSTIVEW